MALAQGRVEAASEVDHKLCKAEWLLQYGTLVGVDDDSNLQAISRNNHRAKTQAEALRARARQLGQDVPT